MSKNNKDFFKKKNSWSEIKDQLLGAYLAPYFQKLLTSGYPICYVDCFAGKGKFEDGKPGSPFIAIDMKNKCLAQTKMSGGKVSLYFIELNYALELKNNIYKKDKNADIFIISGKYEDNIEGILDNKQGQNVFLYIDPYGIKALDSSLFMKFQNMGFRTFEMLINFNSFGFFRDACRAMSVDYNQDEILCDLDDLVEYEPTVVDNSLQSDEMLSNILGGDSWKKIVDDYKKGRINGYEAEQKVSWEYKQYLRCHYSYVLDMPIRLKEGNRPKYRMVYVSNHEEGCYHMAQNMLRRKKELVLNVQEEGQMTIFDLDKTVSTSIEGNYITSADVKKYIKEFLCQKNSDWRYTKFIASFFTEYGVICDMKMIQKNLNELMQEGFLKIERQPKLTEKQKKPTTFWEEDRTHKITIRRCVK